MAGKLFVVEGATGSGKNTLCNLLQFDGWAVLRGTPSQNFEENHDLLPEAQELIGNTVFNFKEALTFSQEARDEIFRKFIEAASIQHLEAVRLKQEGQTVFLNRSVISIDALLGLASFITTEPIERELTDSFISLVDDIDGIILMQRPNVGIVKEREGMSGLEDKESQLIGALARRIAKVRGLPLLAIDANKMSPEQELKMVRMWMGLLLGRTRGL